MAALAGPLPFFLILRDSRKRVFTERFLFPWKSNHSVDVNPPYRAKGTDTSRGAPTVFYFLCCFLLLLLLLLLVVCFWIFISRKLVPKYPWKLPNWLLPQLPLQRLQQLLMPR